MKTNQNFIKNIVLPKTLLIDVKKIHKGTVIWIRGVNGSWYFFLPKTSQFFFRNNIVSWMLPRCNFNYTNNVTSTNLCETNRFLTSLHKVITAVGVGYKNFFTLRSRKCVLDIKSTYVQAKITQPYFVKQRIYSNFKFLTRMRLLNKRRARMEQRMPVIKITGKSPNLIKQWFSIFRKRERPNFYTGQGIRFLKDIVMNREEHVLLWKERKNKKQMRSGQKRRRKKKKYDYIVTIK